MRAIRYCLAALTLFTVLGSTGCVWYPDGGGDRRGEHDRQDRGEHHGDDHGGHDGERRDSR